MAHHFRSLLLPFLLILLGLLPLISSLREQQEDTPITRFQTYLRFNTAHPNPNYTAPVSFLLDQARSIGLNTRTFDFVPNKPVLLLTWPGSQPELPSILFNSHLDTVPAEPDKWIHPPFSATLSSDGKIFARGAQDNKCLAMQYLEAIRNLREQNFNPIRSIHLSLVPDEEIGGIDGTAKLVASKEYEELYIGFALDEGRASPTDEYYVFYGERTPWHVTIRAVGVPGHGAKLYDNSAVENLMKSVEMMTRYRDSQFDLLKRGWADNSEVVSVNPVFLNAGIRTDTGYAMNMQPSEAEAGFDIRIPPTVDPEFIRKRLSEEWAPSSRNMTYKINEIGPSRDIRGQPLMTAVNETNPWWSIFEQAVQDVGGKLRKPEIIISTTDARYIRHRGIPTLGFSPMANTPLLPHEHNEFLQDMVYLKGIKVYESVIRSLSSFEGIQS